MNDMATFHVTEEAEEYTLHKRSPSGGTIKEEVIAEIPKDAVEEVITALAKDEIISTVGVKMRGVGTEMKFSAGETSAVQIGPVVVTVATIGCNEVKG